MTYVLAARLFFAAALIFSSHAIYRLVRDNWTVIKEALRGK